MKESFAEAFKEGVEWCINSMWHDAAEEPERETAIIVLFSEKITKWKQYIILMTLPMIVGRK